MNRGLAYSYMSDIPKAIQDFDTALSLDPSEAYEAYQYRGDAYMQLGEYEKAIADFQMFDTYREFTESSLQEGQQLRPRNP